MIVLRALILKLANSTLLRKYSNNVLGWNNHKMVPADLTYFLHMWTMFAFGLTFIFYPQLPIALFVEDDVKADGGSSIALDLWRIMGALLMVVGLLIWQIRKMDAKVKKAFCLPFTIAATIVTAVNFYVQWGGNWKWYRAAIPWYELFMAVTYGWTYFMPNDIDSKSK